MRDYQVSQRRACVLIGVDPKTVRRERPPDHGAIREAMREIATWTAPYGLLVVPLLLERGGLRSLVKRILDPIRATLAPILVS